MTTYVVLRKLDRTKSPSLENVGGDVFEVVGAIEASHANGAIRALAGETKGTYTAVPVRSWAEVEVAFERPEPRLVMKKRRARKAEAATAAA